MDVVIGVVGDGFTLLAADRSQARSVMCFKHDEDKIYELDDRLLLATAGEQADRSNFSEYIARNIALSKFRTGLTLSTKAASHFIRRNLADALRKSPQQVNMLIAGYDDVDGASLYWCDYLGALQESKFGAHGYGSFFTLSTMDRHWKPKMSLDEAKDLIEKCIKELHTRFVIHMPNFVLKIVDKDGSRVLDFDYSIDLSEVEARVPADGMAAET